MAYHDRSGACGPKAGQEIHPGRLVVWVGDQDVTKAKQPPWPLLKKGGVDLFAPFALGTDPRGRTVPLEMMYSNVLIGSIPGYGKTMMLRLPLLAAALDPRAEIWTAELKGSGDLEAFDGRAGASVRLRLMRDRSASVDA